jgi:hypothetical protein
MSCDCNENRVVRQKYVARFAESLRLSGGRGLPSDISNCSDQGDSALHGATTKEVLSSGANTQGTGTAELALANKTLKLQALANSRQHLSTP